MRPFNEGESFVNFVKSAVPDFVEADYPLFVEFVKAFVSFLEQSRTTESADTFPDFGTHPTAVTTTTQLGGPLYEARKFFDYRDIETTLDEFIVHFMAMFGKDVPIYSWIPKDRLVSGLREFYQSKGSVGSFKWFFRVFFNTDSDIYFPREDVLRASDGSWVQTVTLKVSAAIGRSNEDVATYYVGQRVRTATGTAIVENVIVAVVGQAFGQFVLINEVYLKPSSLQGTFEPGQILTNIETDVQVQTTILPVITDLIIDSGGSNYVPGDLITFSQGPAGGYGYGALAEAKTVANTSLNSVTVIAGGDGYTVGLPVTFVSTSGSGATAIISEIVYGDWLTEEGGFFLNEQQTPDATDYLVLEDQNTIILELLIDPFCNATATVNISSTDYGVDTGVVELNGTTIDSEIEIFLAATDEKPFMIPWVFTNNTETTAALSNVAATLATATNTYFTNTDVVFALTSAADASTNVSGALFTANVIIADISAGNNHNTLYLKNITPINQFQPAVYLKANGTGVLQTGTVATDGTANVTGTNTLFASVLRPNTHIRFGTGTHAVVKTVVNNTLLTIYGAVSGTNLVSNIYSIIATGFIESAVPQSQQFYGKIKRVRLLTQGHGCTNPPFVTSDSISARVQQKYYLEPNVTPVDTQDPLNAVISLANQVTLFASANLVVGRDAGQINKVTILNSGVNYFDGNNIGITAIHGNGRTGDDAYFTPVLGAITRYAGSFTTSRGFLSSDKYLQDETFYNDFVYVVKVGESIDRYRDMLLKLLHPAGFKMVGRVVIIDVATLELNPNDSNPDFAPGAGAGISLFDDVGLVSTTTDMLYIIDLGDGAIYRNRSRTAADVPVRPETNIFIPAGSDLEANAYEQTLFSYGFSPALHWTFIANSVTSNGITTAILAVGDTTNVTDDGPTHIFNSREFANGAVTGATYSFSNANAQLFAGHSGDQQYRGAIIAWFRPERGLPATEKTIVDTGGWCKLTLDASGLIHGYIGAETVVSTNAVSLQAWNMLVVSYTGADPDLFDTEFLDLNAGELKIYLNGSNQAVDIIPDVAYNPTTVTIGGAVGRYGQITLLNEPVTPEYVQDLWNAALRDGTEALTAIRHGKGVDMIYPWYANAISVLASNAISEQYNTYEPVSEAENQAEDPASGLDQDD